jgi:hypothetical protein
MPDKEFLERYPLYRKLKESFYGDVHTLKKVPIHMYCDACDSEQTFLMANDYQEGYSSTSVVPVGGTVVHLRYVCMACKQFQRHSYLKFGGNLNADWVMKIGQYPPWDISLDARLKKALGTNADVYSKGLISESQGYGIGAFAYYRRVVEAVIDQLLDDIASIIPAAERAAYDVALAQAKASKVAEQKIDLVKDLLPAALRPDGMNPLTVLHGALSEGLHAGTDDECLGFAAEIREVVVFLVDQVAAAKEASKTFTAGMRKLLERQGRTK